MTGKLDWVILGIVEVGGSWCWDGSGLGGSRVAVGIVVGHHSQAMAGCQLLMVLLILLSVQLT